MQEFLALVFFIAIGIFILRAADFVFDYFFDLQTRSVIAWLALLGSAYCLAKQSCWFFITLPMAILVAPPLLRTTWFIGLFVLSRHLSRKER